MEESLVPMAGIPALFIMQLLQFDAFEAINSAALVTSMWLNKHAEAMGLGVQATTDAHRS